MDAGGTPSNPGTSINFDAQALHDADEAEYRREEQERQYELQALLTNAFDDLSEDEDDSEGSRNISRLSHRGSADMSHDPVPIQSHDVSGDFHEQAEEDESLSPEPEMSGVDTRWQQLYPEVVTSTPATVAPPLETPSSALHPGPAGLANQQTYGHHNPGGYQGQYSHYPVAGAQYPNHQWNGHLVSMATREDFDPDHDNQVEDETESYPQHDDERENPQRELNVDDGRVIEGANESDGNYGNQYHGNQYSYQQPQPHIDYKGFHGTPGIDGYHGDYQGDGYYNVIDHQYVLPGNKNPTPNQIMVRHSWEGRLTNQRPGVELDSRVANQRQADSADQYKVQYRGGGTAEMARDGNQDGDSPRLEEYRGDSPHPEEYREDSPRPQEYRGLQQEFLKQDGATDQRQFAQLQILYNARGRKIDELTSLLNTTREENERDIRILKHKLNISQDEHLGMSSSLDQCQTLLAESKQKESALSGQVTALQTEIGSLKSAKEELVKKIQTSESTIESLNVQLQELGASESLQRAKQQHDSLIASLRQRYDAEVFSLKEGMDKANRELEGRNEELVMLKKQLSEQVKTGENQQIERADTMNRLTRSLEDSQRHCQELLEAGTGQELGRLRLTLQETIAGKSIAEDMNTALQGEIQELKEQISMYESASQYGALAGVSGAPIGQNTHLANMDDSYTQLGIRKPTQLQFETPESARSEPASLSADVTLQGLKVELERCLGMYKVKRQQVETLKNDLGTVKNELADVQHKYNDLQKEAAENKEKLATLQEELGDQSGLGPREVKLQKELERTLRQRDGLQEQIQELQVRVEELADNEEKLTEMNCELNQQMAVMVRELDEDKQLALRKCEEACLQHHEESKERLRQEMTSQAETERAQFLSDYQQKLSQTLEDLARTQAELDEVKEWYVGVCREKDQLEEQLAQTWGEKMEQLTTQLKSELEQEKETEIDQLKQTLSVTSEAAMVTAKEKWVKEQEADFKRQLEAEIAQAKVDWFSSHQASKEQAVQAAVRSTEAECSHRLGTRLEEELDHRLTQAKETWKMEHRLDTEREIQNRLGRAKQTWQETELAEVVAKATLEVNSQTSKEADLQRHLEEAKESWRQTELAEAVQQAQEEIRGQFTSADQESRPARDTPIQDQIDTVQLELGELLQSKAVLEAELTMLNDQWAEDKAKWEEERAGLQSELENKKEELNTKNAELETLKAEFQSQKAEQVNHKEEFQKKMAELNTKIDELRTEKAELRTELDREKAELGREKDAERRKAVSEVKDQCEKDYRQFLKEHQDTLNKALRSAREQFALEKAGIIRKCEEEMSALRSREQRDAPDGKDVSVTLETKQNSSAPQEKTAGQEEVSRQQKLEAVEQFYQEKLAGVTQEMERQKSEMAQTHRQNLRQALEEAHSHWTQKLEVEAKKVSESSGQEMEWAAEREHLLSQIAEHDQWEAERDALLTQISERDQLLQSADSHMEAEIAKLQQNLGINGQVASPQQANQDSELTQLLASATSEKEDLIGRLESMQHELMELQSKYDSETIRLKDFIDQKEKQVKDLRKNLDDVHLHESVVQQEHAELSTKNMELEKQLEKAERLRQEVVNSYRKSEQEHALIVDSYKVRQAELNVSIQRAEDKLRTLQTRAQNQLAEMQDSLGREHTVAMEMLKNKMMDLRNNHISAMESLRKQHVGEKDEMLTRLEEAKRDRTSSPTQTEMSVVDEVAIEELRDQYIKAVNKMRGDVMSHVQDSNLRAVETVRTEMVRERQKTARRLRRYYLRCLSQLLDKDYNEEDKEERLAAMEQLLDNLPEKDGSSRSTTPGLSNHNKTHSLNDLVTPRSQGQGSGSQDVSPRSDQRSQAHRSSSEVTPRSVEVTPRNSEPNSSVGSGGSGRSGRSGRSERSQPGTSDIGWQSPRKVESHRSRRSAGDKHSTPQALANPRLDPQYSGSSIGSTGQRAAGISPLTTPELTPHEEVRRSGSVTPTPDMPGYAPESSHGNQHDLSNSLYFNSSNNDTSQLVTMETEQRPNRTFTRSPDHPNVTGRRGSQDGLMLTSGLSHTFPREHSLDNQTREYFLDNQTREYSVAHHQKEDYQRKQPRELSFNSKPREHSLENQPRDHHLGNRPRDRSLDNHAAPSNSLAAQSHLCKSEDVLDHELEPQGSYRYTSLRHRLRSERGRSPPRSLSHSNDLSNMASMPNLSQDIPDSVFGQLRLHAGKYNPPPEKQHSPSNSTCTNPTRGHRSARGQPQGSRSATAVNSWSLQGTKYNRQPVNSGNRKTQNIGSRDHPSQRSQEFSGIRSHDPSGDKSYDQSRDRSHDQLRDRSHDAISVRSQVHSSDRSHDHSHDRSQNHSRDRSHDHLSDRSQNLSRNRSHDLSNDRSQNHSRDMSHDHSRDRSHDHFRDRSHEHSVERAHDHHLEGSPDQPYLTSSHAVSEKGDGTKLHEVKVQFNTQTDGQSETLSRRLTHKKSNPHTTLVQGPKGFRPVPSQSLATNPGRSQAGHHDNPASRQSPSVRKPIPMVTRTTQVPSPASRRKTARNSNQK